MANDDEFPDLSDVSDDDLVEELCLRGGADSLVDQSLRAELDQIISAAGSLEAAEDQLAKRRGVAVEAALAALGQHEREVAMAVALHDLAMARIEGDGDDDEAAQA